MQPAQLVQSPGDEPKLEAVTVPADIGSFYQREMPSLIAFVVAIGSGLDVHAAADVAQTAFERALPRWARVRRTSSPAWRR